MNIRMNNTFHTKNMTHASDPFATPQKVHRHPRRNLDQKNKFNRNQCRECEGYNHVPVECSKTRKKNKSYIVTWSNEDTNDQNEGKEVLTDLVALINIIVPKSVSAIVSPANSSSCKSFISLPTVDELDAEATKEEIDDEEENYDEEMARSYKVMYEKFVGVVTENSGLPKQILLLNREKGELIKKFNELKDKLLKHGESLNKLEQIKKTLRMINPGSTILDKILLMGRTTRGHEGLGFMKQNSGTKMVIPVNFVHGHH